VALPALPTLAAKLAAGVLSVALGVGVGPVGPSGP
jgi:hypothetical protein